MRGGVVAEGEFGVASGYLCGSKPAQLKDYTAAPGATAADKLQNAHAALYKMADGTYYEIAKDKMPVGGIYVTKP